MFSLGIHDWPMLLRRCWGHLRPGGPLELLDHCHPVHAEDPSADNETSAFIKWVNRAEKCWVMNGLDNRVGLQNAARLQQLGFTDVAEI